LALFLWEDETADTKMIILLTLYYIYITVQEEKIDSWKQTKESNIIISLLLILTLCLNSISNLFLIFLIIESIVLLFYVLILIENSEYSAELSLKYLLLNAIISVFFLLAITYFYFNFLTLEIDDILEIKEISIINQTNSIICILLTIVIAFKLGLVPFHIWYEKIYSNVSAKTNLFFLVFPKLIVYSLFVSFFIELYSYELYIWKYIFFVLSIFSIVYSIFIIFFKDKFKTVFVLIALFSTGFQTIDLSTYTTEGLISFVLYIITFIISIFTLFMIKQSLQIVNKNDTSFNFTTITKLSNSNPTLALFIIIILLSIQGIPPFAGFFTKIFLVYTALATYDYVHVFLLILASIGSLFFHLLAINTMYFKKTNNHFFFEKTNTTYAENISLCTCIILFLFLNVNSMVSFIIINNIN
jgi:NADH-quinone oxidoreductase subunit N